ncbi:hypothetical protein [Amycolatopsis sp. cmx-4-54]|uniref:hypothetical protein n=1 Tax=Amycolatopsis sp. cmx-4-54 TaxID=2790936 RepID=UPI00397C5019
MADRVSYTVTASALGAWDAVLAPERHITREQVQNILAVACTPDVPVTAAIVEQGKYVEQVALLRDPSSTHSTPSVEDCVAFAERLAAAEGWCALADAPEDLPTIAIMLGLREGYHSAATVHPADVVEQHLDALGVSGYGFAPVHLFSSRRLRSDVRRVYDEPGVMIGLDSADLSAVTDLAHRIRQDRFVVTDYPAGITYALRRNPHGGDRA